MATGKPVLLLQGGVMRCVFTASFLYWTTVRSGIDARAFGTIYGTSGGSATGLIYATLIKELLEEVWVRRIMTPKFLSYGNIFERGRPMNMGYLREIIAFVAGQLPADHTPVVASATNMQTGKPVFIQIDRTNAIDALAAACATPIATGEQVYDGIRHRDGVLTVPIPLDRALMDDAKILFVGTKQRGAAEKLPTRVLKSPWFSRYFGAAEHRVLARLEELERQGRAYCVFPSERIIGSKYNTDPRVAEQVWEQGRRAAKEHEDDIVRFLR